MSEAADKIKAAMEAHGLTITTVFVPYSQSRNKATGWKSLNWKVTLLKGGREVLTTDYGAGAGHCPANKSALPRYEKSQLVDWECENGFAGSMMLGYRHISTKRRPVTRDGVAAKNERFKLEPDPCNVISSLVLDSSVLDESCFENWAGSLGYDSDSRKAKGIYKACLETALKLRSGLGEAVLAALRTACEDY